jgi:hypothetical protein
VATGWYNDSNGDGQGLIETLSGGTWTATEAPLPTGVAADSVNYLTAPLACPSVGSCVATGEYDDSNGDEQGLIETLSGGTWTATEAPLPTGAANQLGVEFSALACPSVGSCVVTGEYWDSNDDEQGLIETLSGGTWTATEAPFPTGAASPPGVGFSALACPSVGSCVATGGYVESPDAQEGLIEVMG